MKDTTKKNKNSNAIANHALQKKSEGVSLEPPCKNTLSNFNTNALIQKKGRLVQFVHPLKRQDGLNDLLDGVSNGGDYSGQGSENVLPDVSKRRGGVVNPDDLKDFQKNEKIGAEMGALEAQTPWTHNKKLAQKGLNFGIGTAKVGWEGAKVGIAATTGGVEPISFGIEAFAKSAGEAAIGAGINAADAAMGGLTAKGGITERSKDALQAGGESLFMPEVPGVGLAKALAELYHWRDLPADRFGDPSVIEKMDDTLKELDNLGELGKANKAKLQKMRDAAKERFDRIDLKRNTVKDDGASGKIDWNTAELLLNGISNSSHGPTYMAVSVMKEELPRVFGENAAVALKVLERSIPKLTEIIDSQHTKRKLGSDKQQNALKLKNLLIEKQTTLLAQRKDDASLDPETRKAAQKDYDEITTEAERIIKILEAEQNKQIK